MSNDTQAITAGVSRSITAGLMAGGYQTQAIRDALLREFVVIPRSELPAVTEDSRGLRISLGVYPADISAKRRRAYACEQIALAEYLEARESEAAETKRNARRDELAREFADDAAFAYRFAAEYHRAAIDRIIELEAQAQS